MFSGYRLIFWGIFFISFHINLGNLQLLPNFIGWAMIAGGVGRLRNRQPSESFHKASILAFIAVIYSIITFLTEFAGSQALDFNPYLLFTMMFISIVELLTEYFIIKGSAEYLYNCGNIEFADDLAGRFRNYLIIDILLLIAVLISFTLYSPAITIFAIFGLLLRIWFLMIIHGLKKFYMDEDLEQELEQDRYISGDADNEKQ